jgi:hypothetical protein
MDQTDSFPQVALGRPTEEDAMKTPFVRAALFVALILLFTVVAHGRALAIVEYCGATVQVAPVEVSAAGAPAATYAMTFSANSSRTVSGDVVFHSVDGNWFDVAFPKTDLEKETHRYQSTAAQFTRTDFVSHPLFVTFAHPMTFTTAFVNVASVTNEQALGWDTNSHACAGDDPDLEALKRVGTRGITLIDPDPQPTMPPGGAPMLHPTIASAPGSTNCAQPFTVAKVTKAIPPDFPVGYHIDDTYTTLIEVAINEKGTLDDAWVYAPSGIKALDDAALRSARLSTYDPRRSFCQDVSGLYVFRAEFRPH